MHGVGGEREQSYAHAIAIRTCPTNSFAVDERLPIRKMRAYRTYAMRREHGRGVPCFCESHIAFTKKVARNCSGKELWMSQVDTACTKREVSDISACPRFMDFVLEIDMSTSDHVLKGTFVRGWDVPSSMHTVKPRSTVSCHSLPPSYRNKAHVALDLRDSLTCSSPAQRVVTSAP